MQKANKAWRYARKYKSKEALLEIEMQENGGALERWSWSFSG